MKVPHAIDDGDKDGVFDDEVVNGVEWYVGL